MHCFFFDASALVKRYHQEAGPDVVNRLLDELLVSAPDRVAVSPLTLSETISVLARHRNAGPIPDALFQQAVARVLLEARAMNLQSVNDEVILHSVSLISRHNINGSDALHLHQAMSLHGLLQLMEYDLVLVASDRRLVRAAEDEGLVTLDPEKGTLPEVESLLRPEEEGTGEVVEEPES